MIIGNTFRVIQLICIFFHDRSIEISKTTYANIKTNGNNHGGGNAMSLLAIIADSYFPNSKS